MVASVPNPIPLAVPLMKSRLEKPLLF